MIFNHNINNLNGGVSQQVDESRYDNQVDEMINFFPTVSQGLRRRNPLTRVSTLTTTFEDNMAIHSYDRGDDVEKYGMILDDNGLKVFDTNGIEKTVIDFGGTGETVIEQWAGTDWENNIRFLTVGDTTWILNTSIVSSTTGDLTPEDTSEFTGFYWIKKSFNDGTSGVNHGYTYQIIINDIPYSYNHTDSIVVATQLRDSININGNATGIYAKSVGSIIRIFSGNVTSVSYLAYNAIITEYDVNHNHIAISDSDESNIEYFNITDTVERSNAYSKISVGGKIMTDVGLTTINNIKVAGTLIDTNNYYIGILYYKDNETDPLSANRVFQIYDENISFTMSTGDSWGNQASIAWGTGVSKISDLPATMEGFTNSEVGTIAITGTDRDTFTNYYLSWEDDHWKETVKEGIEYKIDYLTMPAKLVRQANGTFVLGWNVENPTYDGFHTVWGERDKGDDDSNPLPTFLDNKISNMFFFKNRLGFTSGENVILSTTASYYDFFASTVIEILDTDPIDTAADSNNISVIRAVNVTAGSITLWTDTAQFILSGGDVLSPATTRVSATSTYVVNPEIPPINADNEVLFFTKKDNWLDVSSYSPAIIDSDKSTASKLNAHCPEYIPSSINQVETALAENMVFLFSPENNGKIYIYKYHVENNKRVMSAWFEWTFDIAIKKINVLDNVLFILGGTNDLYTINLSVAELTDVFTDADDYQYSSSVTLSRFGIENKQNTQGFREKFFMKTVISKIEGETDLTIVNLERGKEKTINKKHISLGRKVLISSDSDRVRLRYNTSYSTGVAINIVNIEGQSKVRSRNA